MDASTKAYIAGFLDGDGSIMLQIKPRQDVRYGYRLQATVCFYQDSGSEEGLLWIQNQQGAGYVSRRNDGMSELRINGHDLVEKVLLDLCEYIRFKRRQVELMLGALRILKSKPTAEQFLQACRFADDISNANYSSRRKHSALLVERYLSKMDMLSP